MIALLLAAAVAPSPRAEALGLELARSGTLATMLPLIARQQAEELVKDHPELSAADQATLRATAQRVAVEDGARLMRAMGHAYAARLSLADLDRLVRFYRTPAAARFRDALPGVMAETMKSAGAIDFKEDTLKAFCAQTGKACPRR